jgi:CDP-diacylglycerol--serine O-phosphatidyltransferase
MFRPGNRRFRQLPINSLAPNILTMLALCFGMTSIRFSLQERWELAVGAIVVAALFDAIDGRLARILKGATKFGAELDSLSDFLSFGVAPVVLIYLWSLSAIGNFGWFAVLIFSAACALRLARFNTALEDPNRPAWAGDFFVGVPAPAGAGLVLLPVMLGLETEAAAFSSPWLTWPWTLGVAYLLVSRIPTFSFKRVGVRRDLVGFMLLSIGLLAAAIALEPWMTLVAFGVLYLGTIPFSVLAEKRLREAALTAGADGPAALEPLGESAPDENPDDGADDLRLH